MRHRYQVYLAASVVPACLLITAAAVGEDRAIGPRGLPLPPSVAETTSVIESQCGPFDDSQHVEIYRQIDDKPSVKFVQQEAPSTVQLQWRSDLSSIFNQPGDNPGNVAGKRWCSGTLISPNKVLTAAHCLEPKLSGWITPKKGPNGTPVGPAGLAKLMVVNFKYQLDGTIPNPNPNDPSHIREPAVYEVAGLLEYGFSPERGNLDYAVIEIAQDSNGRPPGDAFAIADFDASDAGLASTSYLTIVQHPAGSPKKVDAGPISGATSNSIFYDDLDTLGGSSGSGIIGNSGAVVGVHTNGGCMAMGGGANRGTALKAVRLVSDLIK